MRMYDIIEKKRNGGELSEEEIRFFVEGYVSGKVPDYQASALLMAIYFESMTAQEITALTLCMAKSGDIVDLSSIPGVKVDKHSTGGVGDKTTLIISPIVASLGVKVAKMSGRGLGHTGGTIDKLESIPGFKTDLNRDEFFDIVKKVGVGIISQSGNLAPADKKLYALRDVTATVESIPLIASSIMSKKLAAGSDCILLDVKVGSGAFMKTPDEAIKLAQTMVEIGEGAGKRTLALVTDMDRPLGNAVGNSLEVVEACETLRNYRECELTDLCVELAANMLYLADRGDIESCRKLSKDAIIDGSAFEKLKEMVRLQHGNVNVLEDYSEFPQARFESEVLAEKSGYVTSMNTEDCGKAAVILGAGRETKESSIDYSAGIILNKNVGDYVEVGEPLATFYSSDIGKCRSAETVFKDAVNISGSKPVEGPIILARVTKNAIEKF